MENSNPSKRQKPNIESFICYFCGEKVQLERNEFQSQFISILLYTLTDGEEEKKSCHSCERKLEDYHDL